MGHLRNLHSGELYNLYSSPNIIRMIKSRSMRWAGHVAFMRKTRNSYRVLVGKPGGKRPLENSKRRPEDNVKMDLGEIILGGMDWNALAQDRDHWRTLVNMVITFRVL
jgi:hypothetical protein